MNAAKTAWAVFRKEILDALRDRRTLLVVMLTGVLMGPMILVALSGLIATLEARAEKREVFVVGLGSAPTLKNYLERQTWTVKTPPADYEALLRASKFNDPVVVVPKDFETALVQGDFPVVEVVSDSANKQSAVGAGRVLLLLQGFSHERAALSLALRGVSGAVLSPVDLQERDLANTLARAAQLTGMVPFFVVMAVMYGALNAALDTTAGERERGSLEPLAMNPAASFALVLGKWGAVATVGMMIALLNCVSFIPAQLLLRSDTLQAMFQYGTREAGLFLLLLLPFAAALSAVLMAVAIRCKTFKEAQANTTVVVLAVSLMPVLTLFNQEGEAPWHLWVPAMAQNTLMTRVLKGEGFSTPQMVIPLAVCTLLTLAGLWFVARHLRRAAVK
jgi:sodium transport system permease protein